MGKDDKKIELCGVRKIRIGDPGHDELSGVSGFGAHLDCSGVSRNRGHKDRRMKDYDDWWMTSQAFEIDPSRLAGAISETFVRRGTAIPDAVPEGLSRAFAEDAVKRQQRRSFKQDLGVDPGPLDGVVGAFQAFLMPAAAVGRDGV